MRAYDSNWETLSAGLQQRLVEFGKGLVEGLLLVCALVAGQVTAARAYNTGGRGSFRQAGKQAGRQTHRHIRSQAGRHVDKQIDGPIGTKAGKRTDRS